MPEQSYQQTLIIVKPDSVRRALIGEIVKRVESKGLKIVAMKMFWFTQHLADKFYREHLKKDFYPALEAFVTSGPSVGLVVEGENAIKVMRQMMGATFYLDAQPGTIRGDFAFDLTRNAVHGSDSPQSAKREIKLIFSNDEIFSK